MTPMPIPDFLTAALTSSPSHGTLTFNSDGSFVYASSPGYVGYDSFQYTASDGILSSAATTVFLNVTSTAPLTASSLSVATTEGSTFQGEVATFTDPAGAQTPSSYTATIAWGDGTTSNGVIASTARRLPSLGPTNIARPVRRRSRRQSRTLPAIQSPFPPRRPWPTHP